jgi:DNA-binding NtrC family response regulator
MSSSPLEVPDAGSARANRRILIVDDAASIHEDFRKILCADAESEQSLDSLEEAWHW